jgi:hypothetical protein
MDRKWWTLIAVSVATFVLRENDEPVEERPALDLAA